MRTQDTALPSSHTHTGWLRMTSWDPLSCAGVTGAGHHTLPTFRVDPTTCGFYHSHLSLCLFLLHSYLLPLPRPTPAQASPVTCLCPGQPQPRLARSPVFA